MRTMVLPSPIASSRSADMPMESVSSSRPPARSSLNNSRMRLKLSLARFSSDVSLGIDIRPRNLMPGIPAAIFANSATVSGSRPDFCGSRSILTCRQMFRRGNSGGLCCESRCRILVRSTL